MLTRNGRIGVAAAAVLAMSNVVAQQTVQGVPPDVAAKLNEIKEIYVATDRKDGSRSNPAPVWFGVMDGAVWFTTSPGSHKARRIKRGSPLYLSANGKEGPYLKMKAEIIRDGDKADRLGEIYNRKYWIAWAGFFRPSKSRNESGKTILLKLTPLP